MSRKHRKWLIAELPGLVDEGVLSEYYAEALREHYEPPAEAKAKAVTPALVIAWILGALLIGGGLLLLSRLSARSCL